MLRADLVAINGAPGVHPRSCRVRIDAHRQRALKIDPGYEKRLQLAGTLADRDHIFYHVRNLACSGEHRAFPFRHAAGGV